MARTERIGHADMDRACRNARMSLALDRDDGGATRASHRVVTDAAARTAAGRAWRGATPMICSTRVALSRLVSRQYTLAAEATR